MRIVSLTALVIVATSLRVSAAATVGSPAPPLEPSEWLNSKLPVNWKDLKGHVILVEKWATWCGPCKQTIPHLNELHDKYEKKGLTVIGVSDESAGLVKPFIEQLGMKYIIALSKAPEYPTDSIPHGWLISPKGDVVWHGHPSDLKEALIEENLKSVVLTPQFSLPKDLKSVERTLSAGKYAEGIKALETHLQKPKSPETEAAAKSALDQLTSYGESKMKTVDDLVKERDYGSAAQILRDLDKSFKGHTIGDKAKNQLAEWKKDDKIKIELEGASVVEKAEAMVEAKQWKSAAGALLQVTKGKKYEGTKIREIAEKRLSAVQKKI